MLEKTEGQIKNGQLRETGHIGNNTPNKDIPNNNNNNTPNKDIPNNNNNNNKKQHRKQKR